MNDRPRVFRKDLLFRCAPPSMGQPVSFLVRLVLNSFVLKSSGGVDMTWIVAGIGLFAALGFMFPRAIGRAFRFNSRP